MGSTSRALNSAPRKDGTSAFNLPHPFHKGRGVCHDDPLTLASHSMFKRKLWIVAELVLDLLDPDYKKGVGACMHHARTTSPR